MNKTLSAGSLLLLAACSKSPDVPLVEAEIGSSLPEKYVGRGDSMGAFTFTSVPVTNPDLSSQLQQVNLFSDSTSGILAGYRGDRPMENEAACLKAADRIDAILTKHYPASPPNNDPRYKHQSTDGRILAGVLCTQKSGAYVLTLEVTDPKLEAQLMSKARNER